MFYDLVDVVEGNCRTKQALIRDKRHDNLFSCRQPRPGIKMQSALTDAKLCEELKQEFDFILVDCPAGIEQGFRNAIAGADQAVIVTTPEVSAVRDADRIIGLLEAAEIKLSRLLINRLRPDMVKRGDMMDIDDIVEILAIELIGVIPDDEKIIISTNRGEPVVTNNNSLAGQAYRNVVQRLLGETVSFLDLHQHHSFFSRLKRLIGFGG